MQTIEAQVIDTKHLELCSAINAPRGAHVIVAVLALEEMEKSPHEWHALSAQGLARAYSNEEMDYPMTLIAK